MVAARVWAPVKPTVARAGANPAVEDYGRHVHRVAYGGRRGIRVFQLLPSATDLSYTEIPLGTELNRRIFRIHDPADGRIRTKPLVGVIPHGDRQRSARPSDVARILFRFRHAVWDRARRRLRL